MSDDSIADDDVLYRRVSGLSATVDQLTGAERPTSACFSDSTQPEPTPMSWMLGSLLGDRSPESLVPRPGGDRLVSLRVGDVRALGLDIDLAPVEDDAAHVHVVGPKSQKVRRQLAALAVYVE